MKTFLIGLALVASITAAYAASVSVTQSNGVTTVKIGVPASNICTMSSVVSGSTKTVTVKCQ